MDCESNVEYDATKFVDGYFSEKDFFGSNSVIKSYKIDQLIHHKVTQYQNLRVFKNEKLGLVLSLDNSIQLTENDECSYQEMISLLPLNSHPDPKCVLIIGGGDGGVAREVIKHPSVENVVVCEVDREVVEASKKYLPFMASAFSNEKIETVFEDGSLYIKNHVNTFDVIITDSSDPIGPADVLFEKPYYQGLFNALKPGGIVCSQAESFWCHLPLIKKLFGMAKTIFKTVTYAYTLVPTYPSGQIGFLLACKDKEINFREPHWKFGDQDLPKMNFRYYSEDIHRSAFVLPEFVRKELS